MENKENQPEKNQSVDNNEIENLHIQDENLNRQNLNYSQNNIISPESSSTKKFKFFLKPEESLKFKKLEEVLHMTDMYYMNQITESEVQQILNEVILQTRSSPIQAHTFYQFMQRYGWNELFQWTLILTGQQAGTFQQIDARKQALNAHNILLSIQYVFDIAISNVTQTSQRPIYSTKNIDSDEILPNDDIKIQQWFPTCVWGNRNKSLQLSDISSSFNKRDLIDLTKNKYLPVIIQHILNCSNLSPQSYVDVFKIIKAISSSMIFLYSEKNELFIKLSKLWFDFDVFEILFTQFQKWSKCLNSPCDETILYVIGTFEFCSSTPQGLELLFQNIETLMQVIKKCLMFRNASGHNMEPIQYKNIEENGFTINIIYSAATVLLDLSANDQYINRIGELMHKHNMFDLIVNQQLSELLDDSNQIQTSKIRKLKDLFIGIVLNLSCNLEDIDLMIHFTGTKVNVLKVLMIILKDDRQDWPTHGAAQALLNYSLLSLSNMTLYEQFYKNQTMTQLQQILETELINHEEANQSIAQCLMYLQSALQKFEQFKLIFSKRVYVQAA